MPSTRSALFVKMHLGQHLGSELPPILLTSPRQVAVGTTQYCFILLTHGLPFSGAHLMSHLSSHRGRYRHGTCSEHRDLTAQRRV